MKNVLLSFLPGIHLKTSPERKIKQNINNKKKETISLLEKTTCFETDKIHCMW